MGYPLKKGRDEKDENNFTLNSDSTTTKNQI